MRLFSVHCPHTFVNLIDGLTNAFGFKVLSLEIKITIWSLNNTVNNIQMTDMLLCDGHMDKVLYENMKKSVSNKYRRVFNGIKLRNIDKMDRLSGGQ